MPYNANSIVSLGDCILMYMKYQIFAVERRGKSFHVHNGILLCISDYAAPQDRTGLCSFPSQQNVSFLVVRSVPCVCKSTGSLCRAHSGFNVCRLCFRGLGKSQSTKQGSVHRFPQIKEDCAVLWKIGFELHQCQCPRLNKSHFTIVLCMNCVMYQIGYGHECFPFLSVTTWQCRGSRG